MVTRLVVPLEPEAVAVVGAEHQRQTRLVPLNVLLSQLAIVGLREAEFALVGPIVEASRRFGARRLAHLGVGGRPEPALDVHRLHVFRRLATVKVAETARSPE